MINDLAFEDRAEDNQPMIAGATFNSASRVSIRRTFSFNAAICCCSAAFFCSSVLRMSMRLLSFLHVIQRIIRPTRYVAAES